LAILHQLAQNHHHHDARGEIVENGREEECHEGYAPQQRTLGTGFHHRAHPVEPAILVDDLDDGHGSHEEEQRGRRAAEMVLDDGTHLIDQLLTTQAGNITARRKHEKGPAGHKHQQGHGGLVHFGNALKGYEQIAHDKSNDNCDC